MIKKHNLQKKLYLVRFSGQVIQSLAILSKDVHKEVQKFPLIVRKKTDFPL